MYGHIYTASIDTLNASVGGPHSAKIISNSLRFNGDGIGAEIVDSAVKVIDSTGHSTFCELQQLAAPR